ncbi:MAG TPA: hypothetical protein VEI51_01810 [Methanomicrobiales archaeon]|nr:hypothetical protein [Methanomicrobiales archaeon]
MIKGLCALILLTALLAPVAADTELAPWSWSNYNGNQTWLVTATESGCDNTYSSQFTVTITYADGSARMDDVGHGPSSGRFVSPNILHFPGRTVDDPPGSSQLSEYDLFFTTDCSAFAGKYDWSYSGPDGSCGGSTTLNGVNRNGCPAPEVVPVVPTVAPASNSLATDVAKAQQDLTTLTDLQYKQSVADIDSGFSDQLGANDGTNSDARRSRITDLSQQTENELQAVLAKDPNNYDANIGMAELRKSQHKYDDYNRYLDAAMTAKDAQNAANDLQMYIARRGNFATLPTGSSSGAVSQADSEIPSILRDVLGQDYSKLFAEKKKAAIARLYAMVCERNCDYLSESVQEAASTGGGSAP